MKIRMKISRLLAAVLLVPLTLTQITFPSKAEESVRKIANLIVFVDFQDIYAWDLFPAQTLPRNYALMRPYTGSCPDGAAPGSFI